MSERLKTILRDCAPHHLGHAREQLASGKSFEHGRFWIKADTCLFHRPGRDYVLVEYLDSTTERVPTNLLVDALTALTVA